MGKLDNLNSISKEELFNYITKQQASKLSWDIYQERAFIENLFCQRFNYFILAYSLILTAAMMVSVNQDFVRSIILGTGIIFLMLIWLTLCRAYIKMIIIIKMLYSLPAEYNILSIIDKEVRTYKRIIRITKINQVIAYIIPLICILSLIVILIFYNMDNISLLICKMIC